MQGGGEVEHLHRLPHQHQGHRHEPLSDRWQGPGHGQGADAPDQQGIGIVLLDVIDLRHQPDGGTEQHGAEGVQPLAGDQRAAGPAQPQPGAVGAGQSGEDHRQLGEFVHLRPVIGEQQNHPQPEDDGAQSGEYQPAPARPLLQRIAHPQGLGLGAVDQPFAHPVGDLLLQPGVVFAHGIWNRCSSRGLAETWAMARAKRARNAETPKQPSVGLILRAPYFYPTPSFTGRNYS